MFFHKDAHKAEHCRMNLFQKQAEDRKLSQENGKL